MKKVMADVVQETTATTGAGALTLIQSPGWARFRDCFTVGDRVRYSIRDGLNWEWGYGTYSGVDTLTRTRVDGTLAAGVRTVGGAALTLASAAATVRSVLTEDFVTNLWRVEPFVVSTNTQMVAGASYIATAVCTLTLPASPSLGDRVEVFTATAALAGVIVDPGAEKINGNATTMVCDLPDFACTLVYTGSTYGWKVK